MNMNVEDSGFTLEQTIKTKYNGEKENQGKEKIQKIKLSS